MRTCAGDFAAAHQLALRAQATAALFSHHPRNRAGRGRLRRHAHRESKRAGGVPADYPSHRRFHTAQVSAGEPGLDESVLDTVQNLPEVRAAAPVIEATVQFGKGNLLILGVDMLGDRNLRSYDLENTDEAIDDPLVFLAQPDSLLITKTFAAENDLVLNSRVPMRPMDGDRLFTVRGIMKPGGLASAFGGNLAIMDIYAAQKVFGRGRKFDRIDIALQDGVALNDGRAKLQRALGPGLDVDLPSSRGEQFEATSRIYSLASNITSLFALFIGMFIIYNTFAIAVTQRRGEIGILRALGATRSQIRTLFLTESLIAGLAGTLAGVAFGIAMERAMAGYIGTLLADVYGIAQQAEHIEIDPWLIAAAVVNVEAYSKNGLVRTIDYL